MAGVHDSPEFDVLFGIKCEINTEMNESYFDSNLAAASSNIIDGHNIKCEEFEGVFLKQDLRIKQEVGEDGDTMLQSDIICKQEMQQEVDNIPGTLSRYEVSEGYHVNSEENQFEAVFLKQEVGASYKHTRVVLANEAYCSIDVKEEVSPLPSCTSTNTLDVSRKVQSNGVLKQVSHPTAVELESPEDSDPALSVERNDIIDSTSSPIISSMLELRPCFVKLGENNILYNSQQHWDAIINSASSPMISPVLKLRPCFVNLGENTILYNSSKHYDTCKVKRTIRPSQKKGRELQKCFFETDSASLPTVNIDQHSDCKTHSARCGNVGVQHKCTSKKTYQCDVCPYTTIWKSALVTHTRIHTGEKPYQCDKCPYVAAYAGNLVIHKRRHTGEKPYQCDKCPYATVESGRLVKHKRRHTGEKPYQCDKCPYAAGHAGDLVRHKRKHTGEKPYQCDKCPYAASQAGQLVIHKRKHTGEKPYQCDKCPYFAAQAGGLVGHKRTHTDE